MRRVRNALFLLLFSAKMMAQPFVPGQTYFSSNGFAEYRCGSLPIILAAPHGGYLEPDSLPDRTCNSPSILRDSRTLELAFQLDSAIFQLFGCRAHVVVCHLHRIKMDANRDLDEAACGNLTAENAWAAYHNFIDSASAAIEKGWGRGFFIDLHGHGHALQQLELGYLLSASELLMTDAAINQPNLVAKSAFRHLVGQNLSSSSHAALLRGPLSFGTLLRKKGYPSVPSDVKPAPPTGEPYFNGGYSTGRHGSRSGGTIDGVQIEHHWTGVRDSYLNRKKYADSLAATIRTMLESHDFGQNFPFCLQINGQGTVCEDGSVEYSTADFAGCAFFWTVQNGQIVGGQGSATVQIRWLGGATAGQIWVSRTCP